MSDLSAGPELDTIIAEQFMGLTPCDQWTPFNFGSAGGPVLIHGPSMSEPIPEHGCYPRDRPSPYSSQIVAAWEVFEKLDKDGWHPSIECTGGEGADIADGVSVEFYNHTFSDPRWDEAWAKTAPLAICRAALRTLKKKEGIE